MKQVTLSDVRIDRGSGRVEFEFVGVSDAGNEAKATQWETLADHEGKSLDEVAAVALAAVLPRMDADATVDDSRAKLAGTVYEIGDGGKATVVVAGAPAVTIDSLKAELAAARTQVAMLQGIIDKALAVLDA